MWTPDYHDEEEEEVTVALHPRETKQRSRGRSLSEDHHLHQQHPHQHHQLVEKEAASQDKEEEQGQALGVRMTMEQEFGGGLASAGTAGNGAQDGATSGGSGNGGNGGEDGSGGVRVGVTRYRWVILAIFSIQNMVNSIAWICFAAMYLQERFGIRFMVYLGAIIQASGSWYFLPFNLFILMELIYGGRDRDKFGVCLAGSIIAGPSMAVFMCLPSKVAALWFPESERTIATTIASLTGVLGVLAGYVIGPAIIKDLSDVPTFLLVQAIIPTVAAGLCIFFRKSPPMPASRSETVIKIPLRKSLQVAFSNKPFVLVLIGFTIGLGCFNALSTLIDQIVHPLKYSEDDSSLFGALLIGLGLVGAGILGFYVEKTHKYKVAMMISIWGCAFSVLWMVLALVPSNGPSLTGAFSFIGIFGLALLPLSLECGCELIFPVPEVVTNGLLMVFGQTFGVAIVFIMDAMKESGTDSMKNACWLLFALVILSALFISSFYPTYKRITHDTPSDTASMDKADSSSSLTPAHFQEPPTRWWRLGY